MTNHFYRGKNLKTAVSLSIILFNVVFLISCINRDEKLKKEAESVLGITLPSEIENFQYIKVFKSSEFLKPYTIFMRAKMSDASYIELTQQLGLTLKSEGESNYMFFLTSLRADRWSPEWWDTPDVANELSGAGEFQAAQNSGWIISTYHNGFAYIKAFEQGTP